MSCVRWDHSCLIVNVSVLLPSENELFKDVEMTEHKHCLGSDS